MAKLNPYLIFDGKAEEAFNFYKSVFGGEFMGDVHRMGNAPGTENLSDEDKNLILHIALPIGNDVLMASDCAPAMRKQFVVGYNNNISVFAESREEADKLFYGLSEGGIVEMPLQEQFWGDYFGSFIDKYGNSWMINFPKKK